MLAVIVSVDFMLLLRLHILQLLKQSYRGDHVPTNIISKLPNRNPFSRYSFAETKRQYNNLLTLGFCLQQTIAMNVLCVGSVCAFEFIPLGYFGFI